MKNVEIVDFVSDGDIRDQNRQLAIKMFFRELKKIKSKDVEYLIKRWNIEEVEVGNVLSLGIEFPDDVERFQWFVEEDGRVLRKVKKG